MPGTVYCISSNCAPVKGNGGDGEEENGRKATVPTGSKATHMQWLPGGFYLLLWKSVGS